MPGEQTEAPLIMPGALAKEFDVSLTTLRNWEKAGHMPASVKTPGGHRRYTEAHRVAIRQFLATPVPVVIPPIVTPGASA